MSNDIDEIVNKIVEFRNERNWAQFHSLKDLLLGLNIEVGELQELFLWKSDSEIENVDVSKIENEIADISIFLIYICNHFNIDLLKAITEKIDINSQKYPVEKSRNSNKKYTEL
ncbi:MULTISPECIES: nucleotide pyrophosphohydrolase [unclassified Oceanispirochaeta]|uniref:nucleotide pyrophosphohydrolase n=1 Tax=unclassified Oceanispirochaeta TaxID=2635722 RepID=UPI000E09440A|nr:MULTISPECIES: nucleotide pyrophosphohydrolase [unclassified Oceanispirochaeta]MBF9016572.1 nucleotide pyrophosphohydrolase [Oceanispirochaeta sp. M2]NPD73035.1 nucleotide pyrophosphohydrolase [Oceanispirochaeta sp. M1]RDG31381.1 nucleotide pyrophosphohydrolase [Oceanispirochaeta sp. M1]